MPNYVVKPGDNLSTIAKNLGVPVSSLTGYKSGNPNLIYPGEVLTYGGNAPVAGPPAPGVLGVSGPSTPTPQPTYSAPTQQAQQPSFQMQSGSGTTPEGIPISSLPPDLVWNGQLDVSNPVKKAKYDALVAQQGQNNPSMGFNMPSQPSFFNGMNPNDIYNSLFTGPQFDTQNALITQKRNELSTMEKQFIDAKGKINDNPFLSEATRVGRVAKLEQLYNERTANVRNDITGAEQGLTTAKADAQIKYNIAQNVYNIKSSQYQQQLSTMSNILSAGGFVNASAQDIANAAVQMGIPVSMLQSIIAKQKKDAEVKPTLKTFDDGTNEYVVALDQNGNVINKSVIGKSKPSTSGSSSDSKQEAAFDSAIKDGIAQLQSGEDWGTVWSRIKSKFPDVPDALIDASLGISWREGGAYESYKGKSKGGSESLFQ